MLFGRKSILTRIGKFHRWGLLNSEELHFSGWFWDSKIAHRWILKIGIVVSIVNQARRKWKSFNFKTWAQGMLEIIICSKNIRIGLLLILQILSAWAWAVLILTGLKKWLCRQRGSRCTGGDLENIFHLLGGLTSVMKTTHEFMCFTNTSCDMIYINIATA